MKTIKEKEELEKEEINGFIIKLVKITSIDDGVQNMPLDEEAQFSQIVPVQVKEPEVSTIVHTIVEVENDEFLLDMTFDNACEMALNEPISLANILFD